MKVTLRKMYCCCCLYVLHIMFAVLTIYCAPVRFLVLWAGVPPCVLVPPYPVRVAGHQEMQFSGYQFVGVGASISTSLIKVWCQYPGVGCRTESCSTMLVGGNWLKSLKGSDLAPVGECAHEVSRAVLYPITKEHASGLRVETSDWKP